MTKFKTGNPVGSTAVKDLYDNAENFDRAINGSPTTWADRLGRLRKSWALIESSIDAVKTNADMQIANTTNNANAVLASLGYEDAVPYASGLSIERRTQMVSYGGQDYAPVSNQIPFVTGATFDAAKWRLINGIAAADLASDIGASFVGRGAMSIQSISDLLAAPRKSDLRYFVKGYHAGTNVGGGEFYWDSDSVEDDNGGTVFSAGLPSGRFKRVVQGGSLDLDWLGPKTDDDSSIEINKFFDFAKGGEHGFKHLEARGKYKSSTVTRIDIRDFVTATFSLEITAIADMPVICALTTYGCNCDGSIEVVGTGTDTDWYSRGCEYGFALQGVQLSILPALRVSRIAFWGVVIVAGKGLDSYGNPSGIRPYHNNSQAKIPKIKGNFCGGVNGSANFDTSSLGLSSYFHSPVNSGSANSNGQKTTITVTSAPPLSVDDLDHNPKYAVISGKTYLIQSVDGDEVTVFPWVPSSISDGTINYVFGGLFLAAGTDSSLADVGQLDAANCAIAIRDISFYGMNASSVAAHNVSIALGIGSGPSNTSPQGSSYRGVYTEGRFRDIVLVGVGNSVIENRGGAFGGGFSRCEKIDPSLIDGTSLGTGFSGVSIKNSASLVGSYAAGQARNGNTSTLTPENIIPKVMRANVFTIRPGVAGPNINELYGLQSAQITVIGTASSNIPEKVTFGAVNAVSAGWTLNGITTDTVYEAFASTPTFICYWDYVAKNIIVVQK